MSARWWQLLRPAHDDASRGIRVGDDEALLRAVTKVQRGSGGDFRVIAWTVTRDEMLGTAYLSLHAVTVDEAGQHRLYRAETESRFGMTEAERQMHTGERRDLAIIPLPPELVDALRRSFTARAA